MEHAKIKRFQPECVYCTLQIDMCIKYTIENVQTHNLWPSIYTHTYQSEVHVCFQWDQNKKKRPYMKDNDDNDDDDDTHMHTHTQKERKKKKKSHSHKSEQKKNLHTNFRM